MPARAIIREPSDTVATPAESSRPALAKSMTTERTSRRRQRLRSRRYKSATTCRAATDAVTRAGQTASDTLVKPNPDRRMAGTTVVGVSEPRDGRRCAAVIASTFFSTATGLSFQRKLFTG